MGIKIQNLTKSYGSNPALKDLSMTFEKKGVVGLLGPNGAGKTTLMKILTGSISRWEGMVQVGNMDLRNDLQKIQKQIGYLPENNPLYLEMYVKEYLSFVGDLYGLKKVPVEEVIIKTGLEEHSLKKIETLETWWTCGWKQVPTFLRSPNSKLLVVWPRRDEPRKGFLRL